MIANLRSQKTWQGLWSEVKFSNLFQKLREGDKHFKKCSFILLVVLYSIYAYFTYVDYSNTTNENLIKTAQTIDNTLDDLLAQHSLLIQYIGSRIAEHNNPNDLLFVQKTFESLSDKEYNAKKILSWTLFDWVSSVNNKLVVNQKLGILSPPQSIFVFDRDYVAKAKEKPWMLHFSPPDIGRVSKIWTIPAGFGITNKQGKFLGIITMGFNVANLNNIVKERLLKESITSSFVVIDEHSNIILKSSDVYLTDKSDFFKLIFNNKNPFDFNENFLKSSLACDAIIFNYYKKMNKQPYIILSGLNKNLIQSQLFHLFFPLIVELCCVSLILFSIFHLYQSRYKKTAREANKAKQQIVKKTIQQLQWDVDSIYEHSNVLLKYFNNELKISISKEKQIEMISKIREAAASLQKFSIININMSYVDIEKLINEVVVIHSHNSFIKDIRLVKEVQSNLAPIYANELGLKQIIIGLVSQILETLPSGSKLTIKVSSVSENQTHFLKILFVDDGFGLSDEDFSRISERVSNNRDNDADLIHFDLNTIISLIYLYNGTYSQESLPTRGKIVRITIPYVSHRVLQTVIGANENNHAFQP